MALKAFPRLWDLPVLYLEPLTASWELGLSWELGPWLGMAAAPGKGITTFGAVTPQPAWNSRAFKPRISRTGGLAQWWTRSTTRLLPGDANWQLVDIHSSLDIY